MHAPTPPKKQTMLRFYARVVVVVRRVAVVLVDRVSVSYWYSVAKEREEITVRLMCTLLSAKRRMAMATACLLLAAASADR